MLFSNRLEIWNPGTLPPSLTIESLRKPHSSHPGNPLVAEPLFLTKYIEKAGTGTVDMFDQCRKAGMKPPQFRLENGLFILTIWRKRPTERTGVRGRDQVGTMLGPSRDYVEILKKCIHEAKIGDLMKVLSWTNRTKFRNQVLNPLLEKGFIEMTIPDKPKSSNQKYRLTNRGKDYLKSHGKK